MPGEVLLADVRVRRPGASGFEVQARLEAPPGVTVLFGPSGSGKSTLLAGIAGLLAPERGVVRLGDEVWSDAGTRRWIPPHRRGLAFVFQANALFPHLSVLANTLFGVDRSLPEGERQERAMAMLERMRASQLAQRRPASLSGGECQRVALARAFARRPRLVLLDEPFSALHEELRAELGEAARALVREHDVPMLHVTHDRAEALALADRVVRIEGGRLGATGGRELLEVPLADGTRP